MSPPALLAPCALLALLVLAARLIGFDLGFMAMDVAHQIIVYGIVRSRSFEFPGE